MSDASPDAYRFALFILSADGQRALTKYGFAAPALPQ
jgi:molybdate transport system substrate-binding protein